MNISQIIAITIFVAMFLMIVLDKIERHYVTLGAGVLVAVFVFLISMHSPQALFETLNLRTIFTLDFWLTAGESGESTSGINWATIIFIAGMMIMVEGMGRSGFFKWLCLRIAKAVNYKIIPIFIAFMCMSAFLAMFIDSITVILFLAAVTCELASILKFNPVPIILSEIFCANLGGSATMCGDPPNIIIGTSLGYTFADFITNTGLIALISLIAMLIYFYLLCHKQLRADEAARGNITSYPNPKEAITDHKSFIISICIFALAVVLLITHAQTGLTVATIGVTAAFLTLITAGSEGIKYIMKRVDYKTLLFFIGLFIAVGGLEQTGVLVMVANLIESVSGGNPVIMVAIILWLSAIASAFVDNIPFAATMVPVIQSMAATTGIPLDTLVWSLSMGTDIGGNATPIGASANVVGTSVSAKSGHPIGWGTYCKYCAPATIIVIGISMACIYLRYL